MTDEQRGRLIKPQTIYPRLWELMSRGYITSEDWEQIVAENEHLYWEQFDELGRQYGGKVVVEKALYHILLIGLKRYHRRTGRYPDVMRGVVGYPLEEFVPVKLSFAVRAINMVADKWYFIRRPVSIKVGG